MEKKSLALRIILEQHSNAIRCELVSAQGCKSQHFQCSFSLNFKVGGSQGAPGAPSTLEDDGICRKI